jgi:dienelactone hydrolase
MGFQQGQAAKRIRAFILILSLMLSWVSCTTTVQFKRDVPSGKETLILTGKLTKPKGQGPFPALVLLHACDGMREDVYLAWMKRLRTWGYVALLVDSFGARGQMNLCADERSLLISPRERAVDAHCAKACLTALPFVDSRRIGVMGWSHGGTSTLEALRYEAPQQARDRSFRAGVAFYPYCAQSRLVNLKAPLLVLIGEEDDWVPVPQCKAQVPGTGENQERILKVYPGAQHGFDLPIIPQRYRGHRLEHNAEAASDAYERVREFFHTHLK